MQMLAVISLTTPVMLGGLTLLALPVLAHLLNRKARRRLIFPTIVYLEASAASQSQLFKLRRWLLLLLRALAVLLRPFLRLDSCGMSFLSHYETRIGLFGWYGLRQKRTGWPQNALGSLASQQAVTLPPRQRHSLTRGTRMFQILSNVFRIDLMPRC